MYAADRQGGRVRLRLAPAESTVLLFDESAEVYPAYDYRDSEMNPLALTWDVTLKGMGEADFRPYKKITELKNLAHDIPEFGGVIRYESDWTVDDPEALHVLEFERVGEIASLFINEEYVGAVVQKPCRFRLEGHIKAGRNRIRVEVMTNPAYRERDFLSAFLPLPVSGLAGRVLVR